MQARYSALFRLVMACLVLGLSGLGTTSTLRARPDRPLPVLVAGAQETTSPVLDLAAAMLSPLDHELRDYIHLGAFTESLAGEAEAIAAYRGQGTRPDDVARRLKAAGWQTKYVVMLGNAGASESPSTIVRSYATLFTTAEGAADGFVFQEDERGVVAASDVPLSTQFGDEAELTQERGISSTTGRPFRSLDLTFRLGRIVAGVTVISYASAHQADPDHAFVEALASLLAHRLTTLSASAAALGRAVLRLVDDGRYLPILDDAYYRRDRQDIPIDESPAATNARILTYRDARDVYQLFQTIPDDVAILLSITQYRFADATSASSWMANASRIIGANPFYQNLDIAPVSEPLGEEAVGFWFSPGGRTATAAIVVVRRGSDIVRVQLVPQEGAQQIALSAVVALAQLQLSCADGGRCSVPLSAVQPLHASQGTPIAR